jgi:hypothetical protein
MLREFKEQKAIARKERLNPVFVFVDGAVVFEPGLTEDFGYLKFLLGPCVDDKPVDHFKSFRSLTIL